MRLFATLLLGTGLIAAPAAAQCPENALQVAVNNFVEVTKPNAPIATHLANIDQVIAACPAEPYVLKAAAMTYASAPPPDAATAVKRPSRTREIFRQMWASLTGNTPAKLVMVENGPVYFGFDDVYNMESEVRALLFRAELIAGVLAPEDQPMGQGAPMRACESNDSSDSQRAYFWIKDQGDHPGAFNLLDRVAAYCEAEIANGRNEEMLSHRARALIASARRDLKKPDAPAKLQKAKADGERYFAIRKGWDTLYWREAESKELDGLLLQVSGKTAIAKEDWFKQPVMSDPEIEMIIAMHLDDIWARDAKAGGIAQAHKIYRDEMSKLGAQAFAAQDRAAARTLLYKAAKAHADGKVRAEANLGLKAPPEFLYRWLDPTYTPPPAAAPAPTP